MRSYLLILIALFSTACSAQDRSSPELLKFAEVSCISLYFKKKNYDRADIRRISAGIATKGVLSHEKYAKTAVAVENYKPNLSYKKGVDIDLAKCFYMKSDKAFQEQLYVIENSISHMSDF